MNGLTSCFKVGESLAAVKHSRIHSRVEHVQLVRVNTSQKPPKAEQKQQRQQIMQQVIPSVTSIRFKVTCFICSLYLLAFVE